MFFPKHYYVFPKDYVSLGEAAQNLQPSLP